MGTDAGSPLLFNNAATDAKPLSLCPNAEAPLDLNTHACAMPFNYLSFNESEHGPVAIAKTSTSGNNNMLEICGPVDCLVVYSTDLPDLFDFVARIKCAKVPYDPSTDTLQTLVVRVQEQVRLRSHGGNGFKSIAFAYRGQGDGGEWKMQSAIRTAAERTNVPDNGLAFEQDSSCVVESSTVTRTSVVETTLLTFEEDIVSFGDIAEGSTKYNDAAAKLQARQRGKRARENFAELRSKRAGMRFKLDMNFDAIPPGSEEEELFKQAFVTDVANALNIKPSRVVIRKLTPGSIVVDFDILPSAHPGDIPPEDALQSLLSQSKNPRSQLLLGSVTSKIDSPLGPSVLWHPLAPTSSKITPDAASSIPETEATASYEITAAATKVVSYILNTALASSKVSDLDAVLHALQNACVEGGNVDIIPSSLPLEDANIGNSIKDRGKQPKEVSFLSLKRRGVYFHETLVDAFLESFGQFAGASKSLSLPSNSPYTSMGAAGATSMHRRFFGKRDLSDSYTKPFMRIGTEAFYLEPNSKHTKNQAREDDERDLFQVRASPGLTHCLKINDTSFRVSAGADGSVRITEPKKRLILYSNHTPHRGDFMSSVKDRVAKVEYNFETASADDLVWTIKRQVALFSPDGKGFDSIAFACYEPPDDRTKTMAALKQGKYQWQISRSVGMTKHHDIDATRNIVDDDTQTVRRVLIALAAAVVRGGRVDVFACPLKSDLLGLISRPYSPNVVKPSEQETLDLDGFPDGEVEHALSVTIDSALPANVNPRFNVDGWTMTSSGKNVRDDYFCKVSPPSLLFPFST
jgi:hypothetical protein